MAYTENVIPTMTDFTSPSGEVSADAYYTTYYPWKALDKNTSSYWYIYSQAVPHYLQYDFGVGVTKKITKYTILPFSGSQYFPVSFKLQGSNNGSDWSDLDTQTDLTTGWETDVRRVFTFSNSTSYRYYKLLISAVEAVGSPQVIIKEFEMMEDLPVQEQAGFLLNFI